MSWSWKKTALVTGAVVGGSALAFVTGGLAAPFVGTLIGTGMLGAGLTGAAATSAGLAALGGGSLAAGGGGMAAGAALVSGAAAVFGAAAAGAGAAATASMVREARACPECDAPLGEKDKFCANCGHVA